MPHSVAESGASSVRSKDDLSASATATSPPSSSRFAKTFQPLRAFFRTPPAVAESAGTGATAYFEPRASNCPSPTSSSAQVSPDQPQPLSLPEGPSTDAMQQQQQRKPSLLRPGFPGWPRRSPAAPVSPDLATGTTASVEPPSDDTAKRLSLSAATLVNEPVGDGDVLQPLPTIPNSNIASSKAPAVAAAAAVRPKKPSIGQAFASLLSTSSAAPSSANGAIASRPPPQQAKPPPAQTEVQKVLANHKLCPEFAEQYVIGDELGSGGFGFVVTATRIVDDTEVAVKFIYKNKVPVTGFAKDVELGVVPIEVFVLKNTHHDNVVAFIDLFTDSKFYYLVMELHGIPWTKRTAQMAVGSAPSLKAKVSSGSAKPLIPSSLNPNAPATPSLQRLAKPILPPSLVRAAPSASNLLLKPPTLNRSQTEPPKQPPMLGRRQSMDLFECIEAHNKLSENVARKIFKQVASAAYYLLCHGIIHRDIKDENIVVDDKYNVKLIDFGSASFLPKDNRLFERFAGTMQYCPPEILRGEKYPGPPQEVWSLGILLYTLLFSGAPFANVQQVLNNETPRPRNRGASEQVLDLVGWMLQKSPTKRATLEQVMRHPWMTAGDEHDPSLSSPSTEVPPQQADSSSLLKRKVSTVREQDEAEASVARAAEQPQQHSIRLTPKMPSKQLSLPQPLPPHIEEEPPTSATDPDAILVVPPSRSPLSPSISASSILSSTSTLTPSSGDPAHHYHEVITDKDSTLTLNVTTKVTGTATSTITSTKYEASFPSNCHPTLHAIKTLEQQGADRWASIDNNSNLDNSV
ncbi:hypothetical protein RI367_002964 [Sorochytrium milnesiophthora]